MPPNHILSAVLAFSFVFQFAAMLLPPLRKLLGIAPIGLTDASVALTTGIIPFVANEALKHRDAPPVQTNV
jgi:P-type Ca2+ transporter type 2C